MFNKRWKKVLAWTLSVMLVLGIGGLFAANYVFDRLMSSMADGFVIEDEPATDGEPVSTPTPDSGTSEPAGGGGANTDEAAGGNSGEEATASTAPEATATPGADAGEGNNSTSTDKPKEDVAKETSAKGDSGVDTGYSAQVSADKARGIQENITVKEKADVAGILLGQISMSDIKRLQELAQGGLTVEEKREARRIMLDNLSEEQYNQLSSLAQKYGVSQGKSKDQILEEEKAVEKGSDQP